MIASLGKDSGYVPYTAFSAKKSYLEKNPEVIQSFTNALQKGMDYVQTHTPAEIAKVIAPQFEETDLETITTIVQRYAEQDTWKSDLIFEEDSFTLLQNILEEAGELDERVPYADLVDTTVFKFCPTLKIRLRRITLLLFWASASSLPDSSLPCAYHRSSSRSEVS